jgi:nitrite reductase (NO-forming)
VSEADPPAPAGDGLAARVAIVHRQARRTLTLALLFAIAAFVFVFAPHDTGGWLPLHLFLAGSLLLAISGATRLLAVTWAAAPPASSTLVTTQRWLVAAGAAGVAAGRELDWPTAVLGISGVTVAAGLGLLAGLLVLETRRSLLRRFDPAVHFYVSALAYGIAGTILGTAMVTGHGGGRDAHVVLNVLGLVGLVVAGTLPFFAATEARTKMNRRATPARLRGMLVVLAAGVLVAAIATAARASAVTGAALVTYALGLVYLCTTIPVPGPKQVRWAGPRLLMLGLGILWWIGGVSGAAARSFAGEPALGSPVVIAIVVGGYLQILVASLAYLGPVLRGGGHRQLSSGFSTTRSWVALVAVNMAALAWVSGYSTVARIALGVLGIDVVARAARLTWGARQRYRPVDCSIRWDATAWMSRSRRMRKSSPPTSTS